MTLNEFMSCRADQIEADDPLDQNVRFEREEMTSLACQSMFGAGLEIDIGLFRKAQARSVIFGIVTTAVPQVLGTAYGLAFGHGSRDRHRSLLSSHTLLALPIATRLGVLGLEPVVVVIGATLVADTVSLVVFGISVSVYTTGFSPSGLAWQLLEVAIFVPFVLIGVSRAGAWMLYKLRDSQEAYFVTMLGTAVRRISRYTEGLFRRQC